MLPLSHQPVDLLPIGSGIVVVTVAWEQIACKHTVTHYGWRFDNGWRFESSQVRLLISLVLSYVWWAGSASFASSLRRQQAKEKTKGKGKGKA